ncbi:MarR family transcriptional regulator [Staphylococcus edaphicus]|uniref:MarR family transcriptional regulator n=1 Tax=Staphylococcus edaphicus TaxID=1955013 RepID=A0A2C6WN28_9STAP|nr:MarR family transcriptional regulator [Staphylococcus edaphicus]PHK50500.1 MarR family transcriptional regulator [Staphylococcus edaphicus]
MNKEERLLNNIRTLYDKIVWLNKPIMEARLNDYTSTEVHCIEAIQHSEQPNVSQLSKTLFMTRGAISKLTKKLIKKNAIYSYQNPMNKKEIYFKLTDKGQEAFHVHEQLHKEFRARDQEVFNQISNEQYDAMLSFLKLYNDHLDVEIQKQEQH